MSGRGGFTSSRGGRGGSSLGRGSASSGGGGKRYSADVTKGPSAWKQEWSGFISGVKMTDQGKKVKLARHADFSGGAVGGYDFSADFDEDDYFGRRFGKVNDNKNDAPSKAADIKASDDGAQEIPTIPQNEDELPKKRHITIESEYDEASDNDEDDKHGGENKQSGGNIFSYLFSSPADRKAEREAKKKEEERKRRERMLKNQRAGLAEYAGDDRSLMERALEHAKVHGISLEGLNRKQKRELLKKTGFVHKDSDEENEEEEAEEDKEIKPHDLMEPKIAWYQQGPFPIDEIAEKLVIKKAAKKAKQLGLKYNSLTVHESWVASRAMKRKLALIASSAPSAVKKTFDDDGNVIYDSTQEQLNNFWSSCGSAPQLPSIISMGGSGIIGFEGGLTAPSAAPLTRGQILFEKYQQQQLRKKQERLERLKAEEEEKERRQAEEEAIKAKEKEREEKRKAKAKEAKQKSKGISLSESEAVTKKETLEESQNNDKAALSVKSSAAHAHPAKESTNKKEKRNGKTEKSVERPDNNLEVENDDAGDDIVIESLNGGNNEDEESDFDYDDYNDDGHSDDDDDAEDDSSSSGSEGDENHDVVENKKSKLSDEEKEKRRNLRREQREKRKLAKKNKRPNAKAQREPKPDSVRSLKQMIFEKYGGKRPPKDVREQLKKAKREAQARRDARKAKRKGPPKKQGAGSSHTSNKSTNKKTANTGGNPHPTKTPSTAPSGSTGGELSNRQLKKLRRVQEFIAKKKAETESVSH